MFKHSPALSTDGRQAGSTGSLLRDDASPCSTGVTPNLTTNDSAATSAAANKWLQNMTSYFGSLATKPVNEVGNMSGNGQLPNSTISSLPVPVSASAPQQFASQYLTGSNPFAMPGFNATTNHGMMSAHQQSTAAANPLRITALF